MDVHVIDSEKVREGGPSFQCDLCDREVVHKIAQVLLQGLATACIDNTTGDLFKGPGSVAVGIRKEMVEYLLQRSQSYLAETMVQEGVQVMQTFDHPTEIASDLIDEFADMKRNLLGRVSGWLLSESREDKIDDFVQEMEMNGFWLIDRREVVAECLLKHIDFQNKYYCTMRFDDSKRLEEHKRKCDFRPVSCTNEGCKVSFCAMIRDDHESVCPFKILLCEQNCFQSVVRREMDRHCITVCPMKLINCPFYQVGCESTIPQGSIAQHCAEFLHFHMLHVLQAIHKKDTLTDELKEHAILLEKSQPLNELSKALDIRSLTFAIKKQEARIKKHEVDHGEASPNGT